MLRLTFRLTREKTLRSDFSLPGPSDAIHASSRRRLRRTVAPGGRHRRHSPHPARRPARRRERPSRRPRTGRSRRARQGLSSGLASAESFSPSPSRRRRHARPGDPARQRGGGDFARGGVPPSRPPCAWSRSTRGVSRARRLERRWRRRARGGLDPSGERRLSGGPQTRSPPTAPAHGRPRRSTQQPSATSPPRPGARAAQDHAANRGRIGRRRAAGGTTTRHRASPSPANPRTSNAPRASSSAASRPAPGEASSKRSDRAQTTAEEKAYERAPRRRRPGRLRTSAAAPSSAAHPPRGGRRTASARCPDERAMSCRRAPPCVRLRPRA